GVRVRRSPRCRAPSFSHVEDGMTSQNHWFACCALWAATLSSSCFDAPLASSPQDETLADRPAAIEIAATTVTVDGNAAGRVFDGVGAISGGGGNSRLLFD